MQVLISGRLSFPVLWTPEPVDPDNPNSEKKFSANIIVEPTHGCVKVLEAAIAQAATEKWKTNAGPMLAKLEPDGRLCLRKAPRVTQAGEIYAGYEGMFWVSANSKTRPGAFTPRREPVTEADGLLYSGCYVNALIDVYANHHPRGGNRVSAQLMGVQFVKHGDSFGGGRAAKADEFPELAVEGEEELA